MPRLGTLSLLKLALLLVSQKPANASKLNASLGKASGHRGR